MKQSGISAGRLGLVTGLVCLALALECAPLAIAQQPAAAEPDVKSNPLTAPREVEGTTKQEASRKRLMLTAVSFALAFGAVATVLARRRKKKMDGGIDIHDASGFPRMAILPAEDAGERENSRPPMSSGETAEAKTASKKVEREIEPHTVRRGFAGEIARGPVLVETHVARVSRVEEIVEEEPLVAVANETVHEKMTPELSGRRPSLLTGGDSGMIPIKSWLDRLLRRDPEPADVVPNHEDSRAAEGEPRSWATTTAPEDYDLPLATRLDQISRQRRVVPTSATKTSSRLQIVPPEEPFEIVVPARRPILDDPVQMKEIAAPETVHEIAAVIVEAEDVAEPVPEVAVAEAAPAIFAEGSFTVLAEIPDVEPLPEETPVFERANPQGPRRPLSFQELNEMAQERQRVARVTEPASPLPVVAAQPAVDAAPVEAAAVEAASTPVVEAEPEIAPPVIHVKESAPVVEQVVTAAATHEPARVEEPLAEYPAQYEADDIEPVYEEVSRYLTSGRWDPIPTLRPDENGWRDRPSPIPPTNPHFNDAGQRRWTGDDDDLSAWRSDPQVYHTEPMPEPLLTRQWGLLSKFQQARMSSGQHPVAKTEDDDKPGSGNGKR